MTRKNHWPLALMFAGAALALQGCDITVHDAPKQDSTASSAPAPDAAAPTTDTAAATNPAPAAPSTDATAAAPADTTAPAATDTTAAASANTSATPSADTTAMANSSSMPQSDPQQPGTNAMGAGAAAPDATQAQVQVQAQPSAMDSTPAGTAAPTELERFLQDNPPGAKRGKS